jgi:hypothetical protein
MHWLEEISWGSTPALAVATEVTASLEQFSNSIFVSNEEVV